VYERLQTRQVLRMDASIEKWSWTRDCFEVDLDSFCFFVGRWSARLSVSDRGLFSRGEGEGFFLEAYVRMLWQAKVGRGHHVMGVWEHELQGTASGNGHITGRAGHDEVHSKGIMHLYPSGEP
jgi:hypothetical protein